MITKLFKGNPSRRVEYRRRSVEIAVGKVVERRGHCSGRGWTWFLTTERLTRTLREKRETAGSKPQGSLLGERVDLKVGGSQPSQGEGRRAVPQ